MNKLLKTTMATAILAAMVTSLAACGSQDTSAGEVKKVDVLLNTGSSKSFYEQRVLEYNKTIGKEKGLEIVLDTKVDSNYNQAIEVAMQSDQLPDMFSYGPLKQMSELDVVTPLNELVGMEEKLEEVKPYLIEDMHKIGDKVYSLPNGMTVRGLVYNKDMFKAAGLVDENGEPTPPETYAQMIEYAKILTDESKMQYGIAFPVKWVSWVLSDILDASAPSAGSDGYNAATGTYDYSVAKPLLEAVMQIKADGSCYPGAEGLDNDPARAKFSENQIGMKFAYSFDVGVFNDQFPAKCDWGVAPLPVANANEKYHQYASVGSSMRVSRRGVDKLGVEAMSDLFKWWYNDEATIELYKQGFSIPHNWELVKDVKIDNPKKGWVDFCKLADVSVVAPLQMPTQMDGLKKIEEEVVNQIWSGNADIDAVLKECSDIKNKAIDEYKKVNPDKDYSIYIKEDWNAKR